MVTRFIQPAKLMFAASCVTLSACSGPGQPDPQPERDPAIWQALYDQLLVDPDLAGQNEANAALTTGVDHSLPPFDPGEATIRAARAEAVATIGGEAKIRVPQSVSETERQSPDRFIMADDAAARCISTLDRSARWAATMPEAFPVFPRGTVIDAAGAVGEGCALRVVVFLSGNKRDDIAAFYRALSKGAGFAPQYYANGEIAQLTGARGGSKFGLKLRTLPGGIVQGTLMTLGL